VKLFVGLGNPGRRYAGTRHNIGFRLADALAVRCGVSRVEDRFRGHYGEGRLPGGSGEAIGFLLPGTYMNASGAAVAAALSGLEGVDAARDLLVAYDDLDLPFGRIRLRGAGGAGGHNGLADVILALGTRDFPRLRFGIGRPAYGGDVMDFVLARFGPDEESELPALVAHACDAAETALSAGVAVAMDRFNGAIAGGSSSAA